MDIDPFEPSGIGLETSRFLDVFLHHCALSASPPTNEDEGSENRGNFARTVKDGRRPGLCLQRQGKAVELSDWGLQLLDQMEPVARLLDRQHGGDEHARAMATQRARLQDAELTPSAKVLRGIAQCGNSFQAFGLAQSSKHAAAWRERQLSPAETEQFHAMAQASLQEQRQIEEKQSGSFDEFIADYRVRTPPQLCQ